MDNIKRVSIPKSSMDIDTVMNSGQCFSIYKINERVYQIMSGDECAYLVKGTEETGCNDIIHTDNKYWTEYFKKVDFGKHTLDELKKSDNEFIRKCAEYSDGMVLLKQNLWETVVSFIISQRRSIPSIKSSLNRIRRKYGTLKHFPVGLREQTDFYSFPKWDILSKVDAYDLNKEAGLGYRTEYVIEAAKWFSNGENVERLLSASTYEEHVEILKEIRGIGDKVANCICLFALDDEEAFPVDTWIQRALDKGLFTLKDIESYSYKGFVQQVIFYYIINHKEQFK